MPVDFGALNLPGRGTGLATLGEIADLRAQRDDRKTLQQERVQTLNERQAQLQTQQRNSANAQRDQSTLQELFKRHATPYGVDEDGLLNEAQTVLPYDTVKKLQDSFIEARKKTAEAMHQEYTNKHEQHAYAAQLLGDATASTYPLVLGMIAKVDPEIAQELGPDYEAAKPKIPLMVRAGMQYSDWLKQTADNAAMARDGKMREAVINQFAIAHDQESYQEALDMLKVSKVDPGLVGNPGPQYQPGIEKHFEAMGTTPEQRATATERAASEARIGAAQAETARHNKAMEARPVGGGQGAGAGAGSSDRADAVSEYVSGLKTGQIALTGIPAAGGMRDAAAAALKREGYDLSKPLTAQTQSRVEFSKAVLPQVEKVRELAGKINDLGLMGSVGGRWRALLSSESGAATLSNFTPEQRQLIGQFVTQSGLLLSGLAMAHGGARGGGSVQMVQQMEKLMDPKAKDLQTFLGNLNAASDVLSGYASLQAGNGPANTTVKTPNGRFNPLTNQVEPVK